MHARAHTHTHARSHVRTHARTQGAQPNLGEIKRLLRRKSELIASGAYGRDDPLIARIEARVMELAECGGR